MTDQEIYARILEVQRAAEERAAAYVASLPSTTGVLLTKRCTPFRRYAGQWYVIQTDGCPHCGRSHRSTVTGARSPRREKLERARNGGHVGRCPYRGWANYRIDVRDEVSNG